MSKLVVALALTFAAATFAGGAEANPFKDFGHAVKDGAKDVGHAVKDAAREVGHGVKGAFKGGAGTRSGVKAGGRRHGGGRHRGGRHRRR